MTRCPGRAGPTILYVEDAPSNQELMRNVVGLRPGVRLLIAATGHDAIEMTATECPTLIVLDRHLPDMSGDEVLRLLRAEPGTATVPVLVVSGDTAAPRAAEDELGVLGYLTKPFDIRALLRYIDEALRPRR